jgi:hypothetical protein
VEPKAVIHNTKEILKALGLKTVWVDSDGFRGIDAYCNAPADELFDETPVPMVLKIAEKMPLRLFFLDPHKQFGKVVWMDQEYISLEYERGYNIWKRVELLAI